MLAASAVQSSPAIAGSARYAYLSVPWMSGIDICLMISSITGSASSHLAAMMRSRPLMNSARSLTFTTTGPVASIVLKSMPRFSASSQISVPSSVTEAAAVAAT